MAGTIFKGEIMLKHWFRALEQTTKERTIDVLLDAAEQIRDLTMLLAPRETGALRNSIAIVSQKKSNFSLMVLNARRFRPGVEVQPSPRAGKDEVYIVPVVGYAAHQEFGTINNGAQPFLIPAVLTVGAKVLPRGFRAQIFGRYKRKPPIIKRWRF